jgi:hypothetical protein
MLRTPQISGGGYRPPMPPAPDPELVRPPEQETDIPSPDHSPPVFPSIPMPTSPFEPSPVAPTPDRGSPEHPEPPHPNPDNQ